MNRYMVWLVVAFFATFADPALGQVGARVEYQNGRVGVGLAVGGLRVHLGSPGPVIRHRVHVRRSTARIRVDTRQPYPDGRILHRKELRYLLGKDQVKAIERHARNMRARGQTRGRWLRTDRWAGVLEVTVGRVPVAEIRDYGNDGYFDEVVFLRPHW